MSVRTISNATLQSVHQQAQIEELVADFIPLKQKGQNFWACCPFHKEKTPSFSVYPKKGFYKCFGCGASGDAITFIREIEGIGFIEAVKHIAKRYGIPIEEHIDSTQELQRHHEYESLHIVIEMAQAYYVDRLNTHPEGKKIGQSYLKKRGFGDNVIQKFGLGYSENIWHGLLDYAIKQGYQSEILERAGLVIRNTDRCYDRFRGRLIFPIHHISGKVVGFGARSLQDDAESKYINSPETEVYHKSKLLYGIFQAKADIKKLDSCYIVEGYTDVLRLHMAGITNVVASLGTSLTKSQLQLISKLTCNITLLFDGDSAGLRATLRGVDMAISQNLNIKIIQLPDGDDPDSYAQREGGENLRQYLKQNVQDFITFKANLLIAESKNDPVKQASAIKEIVSTISLIPDAIKRAIWLQKCSKLFSIPENVLGETLTQCLQLNYQHLRRNHERISGGALQVVRAGINKITLEDSINAYEQESIRMLLQYGDLMLDEQHSLAAYLLEELKDVTFQSNIYRSILLESHDLIERGAQVSQKHFTQHSNEDIRRTAIDLLATPHQISNLWEERYDIFTTKEEDDIHQASFRNILRLKLRLVQKLIEENQVAFKEEQLTYKDEDQLLEIHQQLKDTEKIIANQLGIVLW